MNPNESRESESFLSAATVLAGLPLATVDHKPFDFGRLGEKGVHAGLSGALKRVERKALPLSDQDKYIIFSDHHRGTREGNDDFQNCEATYGNALNHYLNDKEFKDYKLVILGDGEECWEDKPEDILDAYEGIFRLEAKFHQQKRYIRVSGNHDAIWESEAMVEKYLHPIFPDLEVQEGVVLKYDYGAKNPGVLFLVHGHQGTLDSDLLKPLSEGLVRNFYRPFQQITGSGRTSPATNIALRAAHDTQIYRWAKKQRGLIVIAGHTHRPVWGSRTHLEKLVSELYDLLQSPQATDPSYPIPWDDVKKKVKEIKEREYKYPSGGDSIKTEQCYFNTGCCRFKDGDITGIELAGGEIRLVRWGKGVENPEKRILERMPLGSVFKVLELTRSGAWELTQSDKAETLLPSA